MSQLLCNVFGVLLGLFFFYFAIISILENENRAALRSFILTSIIPLPYLLVPYIIEENADLYSIILVSLSVIFGILLLLPIKPKMSREKEIPLQRYDERDIMFSRRELIPGSDKFEDYYKKNPEKKKYDDIFRSKAGLLNDKASLFDPYSFAAAKATFKTVESYWKMVDKEYEQQDQINLEAKDIANFIKKWANQLGVISIGITELKDYHLYSTKVAERNMESRWKSITNTPLLLPLKWTKR